jgi:hypothetical protein
LANGAIKPVRTSYTKWLGLFRQPRTGLALPVDGRSISPVNKITLQAETLEIAMKLESAHMGESSSGMSQILSQLTSLSLQVEDMKKDKGKDKREDIW